MHDHLAVLEVPGMLRRPPLRNSVADLLRERIRRTRDQGGKRLQTEQQLMEEFGVSRQTVREALRMLEVEGLIVRRQGVGSLIASPPPIEAGIETLESNMESIRRAGFTPGSILLGIERVSLPETVAAVLGFSASEPVAGYRTETVFTANGQPALYSVSHVSEARVGPGGLDLRRQFTSMREFFTVGLKHRVHYARVVIFAERADRITASHLGLATGDPVLILEGPAFSDANEPLYYMHAAVRTDQYRFTLVRR
jgi:GntR family transcriptional regulator